MDTNYLAFAKEAWDRLEGAILDGTRAEEFRDVFEFDLKQNVNAVDYSYLVNQQLDAANVEESTIYDCQNMTLFTYADIDLMHSSAFQRSDLALLRRIVLKAQEMVRIGNWVTTWERELREGDYSSGVVTYAFENGIVSADQLDWLQEQPPNVHHECLIETIRDHDIEEVFLRRWQTNHAAIREYENTIDSIDVGAYLRGMESVLNGHMASRGLK